MVRSKFGASNCTKRYMRIFENPRLHISQLKIDSSMANFGVLTIQSKPCKTPYLASVLTEEVSRASFSLIVQLILKSGQISRKNNSENNRVCVPAEKASLSFSN